MANGLTFEILDIILRIFYHCCKVAKFQGNRFKIDWEIAENHEILVAHFLFDGEYKHQHNEAMIYIL